MDGEEWFYIDPFTEKPSDAAVTSYELKELFRTKQVTAECLVWNSSVGSDFVPISTLSKLSQYLASGNEDASVRNVNMGKGSPENWREFTTEEGRPYYHNIVTEEITWEKPDCLKTENELGKSVKKSTLHTFIYRRVYTRYMFVYMTIIFYITLEKSVHSKKKKKRGNWRWIPHPIEGYAKAKYITTNKNGTLLFEAENGEVLFCHLWKEEERGSNVYFHFYFLSF
ncbi:hypothetical protein RFI_29899 [Reticulomyxa filosa]|uniref:WW domain-containing protein n=1 Tax=Reticulomyxa filosa TaxID=46433 RepID=X6M259_RETFI|nr:hypothetical protein RFI_29899 [Reticulomyxa filosa]|eukprot:ETO07492.1 hypothetical protein RFI_29899 [Reticulomyxa filosa]